MAKFNSELKIWQSQKVPYPHPMDTYFGEIMLKACDETPDRVVQFHHEENKELTCRELKKSSIAIARNLMNLGIEADQVVAMICRNSNFVTCFINGCVLMGAIINPLSHQLSADNVKQLLTQTKPQLIVCDPDMLVTVNSAVEFLNDPIVLITTHESAFKLLQSDSDDAFMAPKFASKADKKLLAILCSSGTTGHQKGVCVTHAVCLRFNFKAMPPRPPSRPFTFSDAYWSSGFFLHLFIAFYPSEFRIWSNENFSVEKMIEIVEKQKISSCTIPPSSLAALLRSEAFLASDHESLRNFMIIGSLFTETLREKFRKTFPNKILMTSYGMTEIFVSLTKINECYKGTAVGSMIMQNLTIKIVDENGKNLGVNEQGEIYVKTQFDFPGYYNDLEETKNALDSEGFIKSGDIGYFDEEGCLYIVDRVKHSSKYKNYPIFPSEIEKYLDEINEIEASCVVGVYSEEQGTSLATAVVKRCEKIDEKFIVDFIAKKLPITKQLHGGVIFVDKIPMTPSGKVQRKVVQEMICKK